MKGRVLYQKRGQQASVDGGGHVRIFIGWNDFGDWAILVIGQLKLMVIGIYFFFSKSFDFRVSNGNTVGVALDRIYVS